MRVVKNEIEIVSTGKISHIQLTDLHYLLYLSQTFSIDIYAHLLLFPHPFLKVSNFSNILFASIALLQVLLDLYYLCFFIFKLNSIYL